MNESFFVQHRRQFCMRCNELMLEYYASADGHFGVANFAGESRGAKSAAGQEIICGKCGARYRLLDHLNGMGEPVIRV